MTQPGMLIVNVKRCVACKRCVIECAVAHSESKELAGAMHERLKPKPRVVVEPVDRYSAPLQCRHCEDAPCVAVCPSGALKKNAPGFPVLFERELCIGCHQCIIACPFGVVTMDRDGKHVLKCDLCLERLRQGEQPACATACHTKAITYQSAEELAGQRRRAAAHDYLVIAEQGE
ncbi:MAG: 4Fe-4S dicluster domain-containing protein [Armatimonadota bacterium]